MNRYPLNIFWSTEDKGFIAEAPDLPGCSAWGETEAEAAREAQDCRRGVAASGQGGQTHDSQSQRGVARVGL